LDIGVIARVAYSSTCIISVLSALVEFGIQNNNNWERNGVEWRELEQQRAQWEL